MPKSLNSIIAALDNPTAIDLDQLREELVALDTDITSLEKKVRLYETEFQRELRAKIDLCGSTPACPSPEVAFTLSGETLLAARREAAARFNQVFSMAPLARHAM